jgi:chromosome segregation ATPase
MPDDISTRAADDTSPETESAVELARLRAELEETREALASAERQLFELRDRRSATMGRLERQAYWLERGRVDLDSWMRKRPLFVAFRLFSALLRAWNRVARRLR